MRNAGLAALVLVALAAEAQQEPPADQPAASAEQPPADQPAASAEQSPVIEELTVTGDRPLGVLRHEVLDAENAFYKAFNELVDEPKFKVECDWVAPLGSLIHRRICQPAYVRELQYDATQMALRTGVGASIPGASLQSSFDPGAVEFASRGSILQLQNELKQRMAEAIRSNPELAQLFVEYLQSQKTLETALGE